MRPGFEHTRAAVKERIQTKDNMFSYMVLAVRSNGLRRWRSLYHGLDTPSEATFIAILGLMGTLWRAQRGDEEQLNTLLVCSKQPQRGLETLFCFVHNTFFSVDNLMAINR